jgi:hypothetical protein
VIGVPRFVIETATLNPVFHCDCTVYATVQPVAALAGGEPAIAAALNPAAPSAAAAISTAYLRSLRNFTITTRTSIGNGAGAPLTLGAGGNAVNQDNGAPAVAYR